MSRRRKIIVGILLVALLVVGLVVGLLLVQRQQDLRRDAAINCPGGSVPACTQICKDGCGGSAFPQQCVDGCEAACTNICSGGAGFVCGNGVCDAPGETASNCSADCGAGTGGGTGGGTTGGSCPVRRSGELCNAISCGEQGRCDGSGPLSCIVCPGGTKFSGQNRCSLFTSGSVVAQDCGGYVIGTTGSCAIATGRDPACDGKTGGDVCGTVINGVSSRACFQGSNGTCQCNAVGASNSTCPNVAGNNCSNKNAGSSCIAVGNATGTCTLLGSSCTCQPSISSTTADIGCGTAGNPACNTCSSNKWNIYECASCTVNPQGCQDIFIGTATNSTVDSELSKLGSCKIRQADCISSSPLLFKTKIKCDANCYASSGSSSATGGGGGGTTTVTSTSTPPPGSVSSPTNTPTPSPTNPFTGTTTPGSSSTPTPSGSGTTITSSSTPGGSGSTSTPLASGATPRPSGATTVASGELPQAGVSVPTVGGLFIGAIFILGAILLIF